MQVFCPYPSIVDSVSVLDDKRLNKQKLEAKQIYNIAIGNTSHWKNPKAWSKHPSVIMWRDNPAALAHYYNTCVTEWIRRGFNNNMQLIDVPYIEISMPYWWGNNKVHSSHRAALLAKDYDWYSRFGWIEEPKIDYHWIRG